MEPGYTVPPPSRQLDIPFDAPGARKPCFTHVKVWGALPSTVTPLVVLHGGPGASMDYCLSLVDVNTQTGRSVVMYDQIGNARSTHLPEKKGDATFWTEALWLAELQNVLHVLGIESNYALWGSSWGGMLAARHALLHPPGLKRLVLASAPSSIDRWLASANRLRETLPLPARQALEEGERTGQRDASEYQKAMGDFFCTFGCRLRPMPKEVMASGQWSDKDNTVWETMNGDQGEFVNNGFLAGWSIVGQLGSIEVSTLVTNGEHDEAQDDVIMPYVDEIKGARWVKFKNSSHMAHFEERDEYMRVVIEFLEL
ncbi:proline iminopeptidase [Auriculariales sp. MPI-PUGE-AT-0066]|nr:proline iminopeptidase [Auriculariales sp. MPI-PUGE-AT-0066]